MINEQIANNALSSSQPWETKNLGLKPVEGTLLAQLCAAATMGHVEQSVTAPTDAGASYIIGLSTARLDDNAENAFESMEQSVAVEIAKTMQQHFNFARNTVRPVVLDTMAKFNERKASLSSKTEYSPSIIELDLPKPLAEPALRDTIFEYNGLAFNPEQNKKVYLRKFESDEILEVLCPGSRSFDEEVKAWLAFMGKEKVMNFWRAVFSNETSDDYVSITAGDNINAALFVYLASMSIIDYPPAGIELSGGDVQALSALREQSALRCARAIQSEERSIAQGRLLVSFRRNEVKVCGPVYRNWLDSGGSSAILFGNTLLDKAETTCTMITAQAKQALEAWERQNRILTASEDAKYAMRLKEALGDSVLRSLGENMALAFDHLEEGGKPATIKSKGYLTMLGKLSELISCLKDDDFQDTPSLVRRVVCSAVFGYSNAFDVLQGIDKACDDEPALENNEAALIMSSRLVSKFIAEQIQVFELATVA